MHLTHEEIRSIFVYEERGMLRRVKGGTKPYPWRSPNRPYGACRVNKKEILLHRAIWFYHNGWLPKYLDHIDGNPFNNRIENLRPCVQAQNNYNMKKPKTNTSGVKGVRFCAGRTKPFRAQIRVKGVSIHLGYYTTLKDAAAAYAEGAAKYAGEFARTEA